jgi:PP-loop superfamily ATP-utilizing enzyme
MSEFLSTPVEKARKAFSAVLRVLQNGGKQGQIAVVVGIGDSTMSRFVNEQLERAVQVLYHAGFKVVAQDMRCYPSQDVEAWYAAYKKQIAHAETAAELFEGMD